MDPKRPSLDELLLKSSASRQKIKNWKPEGRATMPHPPHSTTEQTPAAPKLSEFSPLRREAGTKPVPLSVWITLAARLKSWRREQGLSQREAAKLLKMGASGVQEVKRMEKAGSWPPRARALVASKAHLLKVRDIKHLCDRKLTPEQLDQALSTLVSGKKPQVLTKKKKLESPAKEGHGEFRAGGTGAISEYVMAEEKLRRKIGARVRVISRGESRGVIEIPFTTEQFARIMETLY